MAVRPDSLLDVYHCLRVRACNRGQFLDMALNDMALSMFFNNRKSLKNQEIVTLTSQENSPLYMVSYAAVLSDAIETFHNPPFSYLPLISEQLAKSIPLAAEKLSKGIYNPNTFFKDEVATNSLKIALDGLDFFATRFYDKLRN